MRNYRRQDQLGEVITRELSDLMRSRMKDPRIGFASITNVEVSADLRHAKVFVSVMGTPEEQHETMRGLDHASGFLRHELAQRLTVRHVPEIAFKLDQSIARGAHVIELINRVTADDAARTRAASGTAASSEPDLG